VRTLNVRLAAILLVVGLLLGVGVHFLHAYQVRRNAYVFLLEADKAEERAKEAVKEKDQRKEQRAYEDIGRNLGWYVRLVPDDVDALERLGLLLADRAQDRRSFSTAFGMLERVVRQDPERSNVRRRLVNLALTIGRETDAKEHLEDFLLKQSPDDPELLELLGRCQADMGDDALAAETFKKAIQYAPTQAEAYIRLAGVLRYRLARPKEADQWMEKLVKANPTSFKAHYLRGSYLKSINADDEALKESLIALELAPKDGDGLRDALGLAAQCSSAKGNYDDARKYAERGIKLYPDNIAMYATMADVELRAGQRDKAIIVLRQGLKATTQNPDLLWTLANLLIDTDKLKEAEEIIEELLATEYPKQRVEYLSARIEFVQGHWKNARLGFEKARGALIRQSGILKQVDVWIGQCYGQLRDTEQQLVAYRRALSVDPFYAPALAGVTEALLGSGRVDEALDEYAQLAKSGKIGLGGAIPLARMLILKNLRLAPAEQDWEKVQKVLNEAEKTSPDSVQIPILRSEILVAQKRLPEAETLLRAARDKDPKKVEIWNALVFLLQRQRDWEGTEKLLDEMEKTLGDSVDLRLARAQYFVRRFGADAKDRVRKLAEHAEKFSDSQRLQLWNGLLNAAIQANDAELTTKLCRLIADKEADNVKVRMLLFEQALRAEDDAEMERALKEVDRVAGRGAFWLYGQAVRLSLQAREKGNKNSEKLLDQALKYLSQARELQQTWSRIPLLAAGIYDQQGNTNRALKNYLDAIEMGERNPGAIRRTVQLLFQKQQYADADKLLRRLERQQVPFSPELIRMVAEVALRQGDFERALEMARKAVALDSKNFQEHLWLGQVLGILGRRAKSEGAGKRADELLGDAEKALRRAVEIEPKLAETWVALIQFLSANEDSAGAEKAIEEAGKKIPAKQAPLALAQCFEVMKKMDAAQEKYEAALSAAPEDPFVVRSVADFYYRAGKAVPAEALLKRILDGKVKAQEPDIIWARRNLAIILAARGGYQNTQKARDLIEENLAASEVSVLDRRVMASLSASDPKPSLRAKAIGILEEMLKEQSATPEDRYALAQMYLAAGAWAQASGQLRNLVASYGNEPRFVAAYAKALMDHNETATAELYLERLEKIAPAQFITASLQADTLFRKKEYEKTLDLLKSFLDNKDAQPSDRGVRMRLVAEKLEELAHRLTESNQKPTAERYNQQAEMLYRVYVDQNKEQELLLVAFLGRQGRVDDALELLDRIWQDSNPAVLAQVSSILQRDGKAGKEQMQRLDRILQAALKLFERPVPLLLTMAEIRTTQSRYAEAEGFYREVLQKNSGNAVAMNNLAVLLALQGIKLDESLKLVNQAIEIAGPVAAMLDSRATVRVAVGEYDKALEDMAEALTEAETPVRLFHQALAYEKAGQPNAAAAAMEKAVQKGLTKGMLQPLELPAFEKLRQLPR